MKAQNECPCFDVNTRKKTFAPLNQLRRRQCFACNLTRHWSTASSAHRRHELSFSPPALLHFSLNCVVNGFRSGFSGANVWWNERRCLSLRRLVVSRARWAGALCCWKSPQILRTAGNSFCMHHWSSLQDRQLSGPFTPSWTHPQTRSLIWWI